ncbi:MAG: hypothetical protein U0U66_03645 [Cytophagaceae bacterium]
MKKVMIAVAMLSLVTLASCEKEKALEEKLGGDYGMDDNYGLTSQEFAQIDSIKKEIKDDIRRGDSLTIAELKMEIELLKEEIKSLKKK